MTEYMVPANISKELTLRLQERALKSHQVLGCSDFSRVDFMLDQGLREYVIEVNTIPGFTNTSLFPKAANQSGLNFDQLCLKIIEFAYEKKEYTKSIPLSI